MKIGEGAYAVVYKGQTLLFCIMSRDFDSFVGREVSTGRQVAIKKIKVGQFKDGLDMSAIREVKYLRELKHQNVIDVSPQNPSSLVLSSSLSRTDSLGL